MCVLENPRKTSISTKPEIKKIVGLALCLSESWTLQTWDFAEPPRSAFWKTLGKRVLLQSQISRNRRVGLGHIRELNTTKRGILQSPPRCAFWKTLGKRVFLQSQKSRRIVGLALGFAYQRAEHYKTWDFAEPPRSAFWKTLGKRVLLRSQISRNRRVGLVRTWDFPELQDVHFGVSLQRQIV